MHADTINFEKFSRQIILPFVGTQGQHTLADAHIVVVGCGGLGCPLLLYLAASGIGKITIIDNDVVSYSNLHRQILFNHHDIGQYKSDIAAQKLMAMHPDTQIISVPQRLDTPLGEAVCGHADLVIDGTDSFLSKYILSEICPLFLTASVVGTEGYIAGFNADIRYKDIFPCIPDNAPNCSQTGVLPSVAGLIGTFLATEAIKIILKHTHSIMGKMIQINMDNLRFTIMNLTCNLDNQSNFTLPVFEYLTPQDIHNRPLIDVREVHELENDPLWDNAVSMPLSCLNMNDLWAFKDPVFKCHTGRRAERVALKFGLSGGEQKKVGIII